MDRCEEDVFTVVQVKPWLVLECLDLTGRKRRDIRFLDKNLGLDQSFYNFLGSITMMNVEIDNCNFLNFVPVLALEVRSCNRYIIDEAEAI
jgi:hypothetical protein